MHNHILTATLLALSLTACSVPTHLTVPTARSAPNAYASATGQDTVNAGLMPRNQFFTDSNLVMLIDTALAHNQELKIALQEININQFEIRARQGEYLPFLSAGVDVSAEKAPRYTRNGAVEDNLDIEEGRHFPEPLPNYRAGVNLSWEVDIWHRLRNAKKSAIMRYYAGQEGRNFLVTNLVAEIASSYYELVALDNELEIVRQSIALQENMLNVVRLQKEAARVTELAVRRFEAELLKNQSRVSFLQQQIAATEIRINRLTGRYPQPIKRITSIFGALVPQAIQAGIPSQLLTNRPDIRQAERLLQAAQIDVNVARAAFFPQLTIDASLGFEAFNPSHLVKLPASLAFTVAGGLAAPLINRNAIRATYNTATAHQIQRVYEYEQTLVRAYAEVATQQASLINLQQAYDLKDQQVAALADAINISQALFRSARADYSEVLLTQREALEARVELVELRMQQLNAVVNTYRALGGGWR